MNTLRLGLIVCLCLAALLAACDVETQSSVTVDTDASAANENFRSEERDVGDFSRVRLETLGDLNLTQGDEVSVTLELSPKYEGVIETEVKGDTLVIRSNTRNLTQVKRDVLRYNVTASELEAVELAGSGDVSIGSFSAQDLALALSGSGDIAAQDLEAERLELALGGSGDISVAGSADELTVGLAGSGDVDAQGLRAQEVEVGLAGSGDVGVCASSTLEVDIAGSGDVTYYGEPQRPDISVMGSGEVDAGGDCP